VTPRENRLLNDIERAMKKSIKQIEPPSLAEMREKRSSQFAEKVMNVIEKSKKLGPYREMIESIAEQSNCDPKEIAAALAYLMQQSNPIPSNEIEAVKPIYERRERKPSYSRRKSPDRSRSKNKRSANASDKKRRTFKSSSSETLKISAKKRKTSKSPSSDAPGMPSRKRKFSKSSSNAPKMFSGKRKASKPASKDHARSK